MQLSSGNNFAAIDNSFIEDLKSRINIVDLISRTQSLKKSGNHYECCCPFHNEKTPSFKVSENRQTYHCFGCGESGDVINWMEEYNGCSFPEAIRELAGIAGVEVPRDADQSDELKKASSAAYNLGSALRKILHEGTNDEDSVPLSLEAKKTLMAGTATNARLVNGMLKKYQNDVNVSALRPINSENKPGIATSDGFSVPLTTKKGAVTGFVFFDKKLKPTPMALHPQYEVENQWLNMHNIDPDKDTLILYDALTLHNIDKNNRISDIQFLLEPRSKTQISERQMHSALRSSNDIIFVIPNNRYRASAALYSLVNHSDINRPIKVMPFSMTDDLSSGKPQYLYDFLFKHWSNLDERVTPKIDELLSMKGLDRVKDLVVNGSAQKNQQDMGLAR